MKIINNLLDDNHIVTHSLSFKKTRLEWANDLIQEGLQAIDNNFVNNLIDSVTKTNQSEVLEVVCIMKFRNKAKESLITGRERVLKIS